MCTAAYNRAAVRPHFGPFHSGAEITPRARCIHGKPIRLHAVED